MEFARNLIIESVLGVWTSFLHNWPFLIVSIFVAVSLKLFVDTSKISGFLTRYRNAGVLAATLAAVTTPFCSCGTTAVILGMMASTIPWSPIIAFMVASPLTSPEELIYSAGLFGWPFALAFFISSILLGLMGGLIGVILERKDLLKNQSRYTETFVEKTVQFSVNPVMRNRFAVVEASSPSVACSSCAPEFALEFYPVLDQHLPSNENACGCKSESGMSVSTTSQCEISHQKSVLPQSCCEEIKSTRHARVTLQSFLKESFTTGKRLTVMFFGFALIGYLMNGLIPSSWVSSIFGQGNIYSVPLAATLGVPLYINTEGSLPLVRTLVDSGMSQGAALAFLITGAGTSIGAMAGALTIARWRVVAVVIGTLWIGGIGLGYAYNFILAIGLV
ncbi:MAG: hypothetical protein CVU46_05495 [Chloroflexi bacterium HGW-Chloroflexi-8]|nr:MAG: hypothetical protein CVU46_05495 [Chloroflexi bacterium HGW-Chloroflexi-8]